MRADARPTCIYLRRKLESNLADIKTMLLLQFGFQKWGCNCTKNMAGCGSNVCFMQNVKDDVGHIPITKI